MIFNGVLNFVVAVAQSVIVGEIFTGGDDNFVVPENFVAAQKFSEGIGAVDVLQEPESVLEFFAKGGRKGKIFFGGKVVEEIYNVGFVNEFAGSFIGAEKFVEVEGAVDVFAVLKFDAAINFIDSCLRNFVAEHVHLRQIFVGVAGFFVPVRLSLLLFFVGPVENLSFVKFVAGECFKGRAGKIQRKGALDFLEGGAGFLGVNALVRLVDDKKIPLRFGNPV